VTAEDEGLRPQACREQARDGAGVKSDAAKALAESRGEPFRRDRFKIQDRRDPSPGAQRLFPMAPAAFGAVPRSA
jgi:hypothetical protein